MEMVNKLVNAGMAFPCFCTDEEIDQMKADAEAQGLPPVYRGKWKTATQAEVDAELAKGTKPVYRFRVPENEDVTIVDQVGVAGADVGLFILRRRTWLGSL